MRPDGACHRAPVAGASAQQARWASLEPTALVGLRPSGHQGPEASNVWRQLIGLHEYQGEPVDRRVRMRPSFSAWSVSPLRARASSSRASLAMRPWLVPTPSRAGSGPRCFPSGRSLISAGPQNRINAERLADVAPWSAVSRRVRAPLAKRPDARAAPPAERGRAAYWLVNSPQRGRRATCRPNCR